MALSAYRSSRYSSLSHFLLCCCYVRTTATNNSKEIVIPEASVELIQYTIASDEIYRQDIEAENEVVFITPLDTGLCGISYVEIGEDWVVGESSHLSYRSTLPGVFNARFLMVGSVSVGTSSQATLKFLAGEHKSLRIHLYLDAPTGWD